MSQFRSIGQAIVLAIALLIGVSSTAGSAELVRGPRGHALVMVDDPACPYCVRWRKEVGPGYRLSAEGRFAPLNIVMRASDGARQLANVHYTPTFVLLAGDREIGRIVGYGGSEMFWSQAQNLFAEAGFQGEPAGPAPQPPGERGTKLNSNANSIMLVWQNAPVGRAHE